MRLKDRKTGEPTDTFIYQVILNRQDPEERAVIDHLENMIPGRRQDRLRQWAINGARQGQVPLTPKGQTAISKGQAPASEFVALDEFSKEDN